MPVIAGARCIGVIVKSPKLTTKYTCRTQSVAIVIEENHRVAKSDGYWRLIFCAERNDKISQS